MMKAIIEKSSDGGYGIYAADDAIPVVSSGATEDEAKKEFEACKREQAEYIKEQEGAYPTWKDEPIDYRYDMTAFFKSFPFINATQFAKALGVNPSLLRKYKSGLAQASAGQKDAIQHKFDEIITRLSLVKF